MPKQNKIIKKLSQLYAGIFFYYSDFLSLKETVYNNTTGLIENYFSRIRVIEKNTLGTYISSIPFTENNIEDALKAATLNSRVASIFPAKKSRVYYPYIHNTHAYARAVREMPLQGIARKIDIYKRRYRPDSFDYTVTHTQKLIMSSVGTIIKQDYKTIKFTIIKGENKVFNHYKFSDLKDIKFPILNKEKIEKLYNKYNIILSPRTVGKLAIYLFENNIKLKTLSLKINPYLYRGLQSNRYDHEGTTRLKSEYKGLIGGDILNNKDNSCGYYYNFKENKFKLNMPDLEVKSGNIKIKEITQEDYLLAEDFEDIKLLGDKISIKLRLTLFSNKKTQGYLSKNVLIDTETLKDIEKITKSTKVSGLESSSIQAPYIFIGKDYE